MVAGYTLIGSTTAVALFSAGVAFGDMAPLAAFAFALVSSNMLVLALAAKIVTAS